MTHNNKLAQAELASNTQQWYACAPFLRAARHVANNQFPIAALTILAQANGWSNTQDSGACASFFGMAVSTTDTRHMVAMPTILAATKSDPNTHECSVAAPILGLHRRPSEYPPRRRVGHHKSCGNTSNVSNTQKRGVSPALILEVSH